MAATRWLPSPRTGLGQAGRLHRRLSSFAQLHRAVDPSSANYWSAGPGGQRENGPRR